MPWLNTDIDDWAPDDGVLEKFEVVTIPKTILVDDEGRIVAVDRDPDAFLEALVSHMGY